MSSHPLHAVPFGGAPATSLVPVDPSVGLFIVLGVLALACGALWMLHRLESRDGSSPRGQGPVSWREAA